MSLTLTPLDTLHRELGARMVPFAGYDMPVQYAGGIIAEHRHTREAAGLFDVSHMGQLVLTGPGATATLESLVPADLVGLPPHRQTYALLTNDEGGVRDDLIITRWDDETFFLVVNAACKAEDRAWISANLGPGQSLRELENQALLALQGPRSRAALCEIFPTLKDLPFLHGVRDDLDGVPVYITCSGYTGEDGFEISLPGAAAESFARRLLADDAVQAAGLGARDSLRLEAGLCLYGHELSPTVTPVEARVSWSIAKARRPGGVRAGAYPGADVVATQLAQGAERARVGLKVMGKRPVREGQTVLDDTGTPVGEVTSGAFGATVDGPIAMAFVLREVAEIGRSLHVDVRGKHLPVEICRMPFVPQRYFRG